MTFMTFWKTLNAFAKSHGLPEVLYGEARGYYREYR